MLTSHNIDYKLSDGEMDDIGEKMGIEVTALNVRMVTLTVEKIEQIGAQCEQFGGQSRAISGQLTAQREQLRALQVTVLPNLVRYALSTILHVFAGEQSCENMESSRFHTAKSPFLSRITKYVEGSN